MNILFLTLLSFDSLEDGSIYTDLLKEFVGHGHEVYAISPVERRQHQDTHMIREGHCTILRLKIGNTQKTNIIEKGISTVLIEPAFKNAIRKYFSDIRFDLVLYSTPPITLVSAIQYVKERDHARTYLLLKDIFPQNAVDIGMMDTSGPKSILYRRFRNQEKELYQISDRIGCMSEANVRYVLDHNPEVPATKVEVCPNSMEVTDRSVDEETRIRIRRKYDIPVDKKVLVYGGNLGKPQGIGFLIACLRACRDIREAFFLIVGDGTEFPTIQEFLEKEKPENVRLMKRLPREDYDIMVGACDVGMIFLDHRFTIPNFPSRLLSYMAAKLPVLAVTDPNSDVGTVVTEGGFGWWQESNDAGSVKALVEEILEQDLSGMKEKAWQYLQEHYTAEQSYQIIEAGILDQ